MLLLKRGNMDTETVETQNTAGMVCEGLARNVALRAAKAGGRRRSEGLTLC